MGKNGHTSRVAKTSGAWSSSAIIGDHKDSRGQLSGVHTGPSKGSTTGRPSGSRLPLQPRYLKPVGALTCLRSRPHQGPATNCSHSWKALRLALSGNGRCVCSKSLCFFQIGRRGYVKPLTPCGSALEIYRPPPRCGLLPGPVSNKSFAWHDR
jgi:hypothetical protein